MPGEGGGRNRSLDLEDGLAKVATGVLGPEVLHVLASRGRRAGSFRPDPQPGTMRGGARRVTFEGAEGRARHAPLDDADVVALARLLGKERSRDCPSTSMPRS